MTVRNATADDFVPWLRLAAEVESFFGPLVGDARFEQAVQRNIARGSAYCVREADGPPGSTLWGGMLFSSHPPRYRIGWIAVSEKHRRLGIGRLLVESVLAVLPRPAEIEVTTFGPHCLEGEPARRFYLALGFVPGELTVSERGQERQIYRKVMAAEPPW